MNRDEVVNTETTRKCLNLLEKKTRKLKQEAIRVQEEYSYLGTLETVTVLNADVSWITGAPQYTAGECSQMPRGRAAFNPGILTLKPHP